MGEQRKSGDAYYYLSETNGAMVRNQLVELESGKYYFGADGSRVAGVWQKIESEDAEDGYGYMYFTGTGKAATKLTTITGGDGVSRKYWFTSDGWMLYGYLTEDGSAAGYASAATYYFGTKEEGWRYTGWINVKDGEDEIDQEAASLWFYFGSNGQKVTDKSQYRVASGKRYNFDEYGRMMTGWVVGTSTVASGTDAVGCRYYGTEDDGSLKKNQWIRTDYFNGGYEVGDELYDESWYYVNSSGDVLYGSADGYVKKVKSNGLYYCFDTDGRMLSGAVAGTTTDPTDPTAFVLDKEMTKKLNTSTSYLVGDYLYDSDHRQKYYIMFFSNDEETDGAMKTGSQKIVIDDSSTTLNFDKHGYALEGFHKGYFYNSGVLQSAGSSIVALAYCRANKTYYLVNRNGKQLYNYTCRNSSSYYWAVTPIQDDGTWTIYYVTHYDSDIEQSKIETETAKLVKNSVESDWTDNVLNKKITKDKRTFLIKRTKSSGYYTVTMTVEK